jgi:hypothetical protein
LELVANRAGFGDGLRAAALVLGVGFFWLFEDEDEKEANFKGWAACSQNHLLRNSNNYVKDKEIKATIAKR